AIGRHRHGDFLGLDLARFAVASRQIDLQAGDAREGGGQHQEDDDHQHHVDQRNQADLRLLVLDAALEVHRARSPCTTSTRRMACCSMSITKVSTSPRKWRQKMVAGIAMMRPKPVVLSAIEMPCASCCGLAPPAPCEAKMSIMPMMVPNRPSSG